MNQSRYVAAVLQQLENPVESQVKQLLPLLNEAGNGLAAAVVTFPMGPAKLGVAAGLTVELVGRPFLVDGMYRRQTKYPVELNITLQPVSNYGEDDAQSVWGQPFELTVPERMQITEAIVQLAICKANVVSVMHSTDEEHYVDDNGVYSHAERAVHLMFGVAIGRAGVILNKSVTVARRLDTNGNPVDGFDIVNPGGSATPISRDVVVDEVMRRLYDAFSDTVFGMCVRDHLANTLRAGLLTRLHEEVARMAHEDLGAKGFKQHQTQRVRQTWEEVFGRWPAIILEVNHRVKDNAVRPRRALELE